MPRAFVVEGSIASERYDRNDARRSIKARVVIQSSEGALHEVSLWGRQANIYGDLTGNCGRPQGAASFVILRHLDSFLGVECRGDPHKR